VAAALFTETRSADEGSMVLGLLYVYLLPVGTIAAAVGLGFFLARRARRTRNASLLTAGIAIAAAGVALGARFAWFVAWVWETGSFAGILLWIMPPRLALAILAASSVLVSAAWLVLWLRASSWRAAGYVGLPTLPVAALSLCVILVAGGMAWVRAVGPWWQLQPYESLSASNDDGIALLLGWNPRTQQDTALISIDHRNAPGWRVSFDLASVDARGRIAVGIRPEGVGGESRFVSIPFEESAYALTSQGTLTRRR